MEMAPPMSVLAPPTLPRSNLPPPATYAPGQTGPTSVRLAVQPAEPQFEEEEEDLPTVDSDEDTVDPVSF